MGLEQSIENVVSRFSELADKADAAIAAIPDFRKRWTVDQINGNDNALGTTADPLASVHEAVSRTPAGGCCLIKLVSDYHFDAEVQTFGIMVEIYGENRPKLTFDWVEDNNTPGQINRLASFRPYDVANFRFRDMDIEFPADPVEPFLYDHMKGLIAQTGSEAPGHVAAQFTGVNFYDATGSTQASVFGRSHSIVSAFFNGCTFPADFEGRIRQDTGGVGVDPASVTPFIQTNLSWI